MIGVDPLLAIVLIVVALLVVAAFGKILLAMYDAKAIERHKRLELALQQEAARLTVLQSRVDALHRLLPLEYVRREDWIRFSASIDAKIDRIVRAIAESSRSTGMRDSTP